jgi:hypothetical protein
MLRALACSGAREAIPDLLKGCLGSGWSGVWPGVAWGRLAGRFLVTVAYSGRGMPPAHDWRGGQMRPSAVWLPWAGS